LYWALCGHPPDERASEDLPLATRRLLDLPRESQLDILRDFLTATTAKDCGLMLTFEAVEAEEVGESPASEHSNTTILALGGRSYLCKVRESNDTLAWRDVGQSCYLSSAPLRVGLFC
jgi:hypothetical protein